MKETKLNSQVNKHYARNGSLLIFFLCSKNDFDQLEFRLTRSAIIN